MQTTFTTTNWVKHPANANIWVCHNARTGREIGVAVYCHVPKLWVFNADDNSVFSADTLTEIVAFLKQLEEAQCRAAN